jgi:hypothetical protein
MPASVKRNHWKVHDLTPHEAGDGSRDHHRTHRGRDGDAIRAPAVGAEA